MLPENIQHVRLPDKIDRVHAVCQKGAVLVQDRVLLGAGLADQAAVAIEQQSVRLVRRFLKNEISSSMVASSCSSELSNNPDCDSFPSRSVFIT
jgi:hypothetical protein